MTPLSRSEGQRSRSPGRFGWLYWQANMDIELVTNRDACMMYIVSPLAGLAGHIVAASRLQLVVSAFCLNISGFRYATRTRSI